MRCPHACRSRNPARSGQTLRSRQALYDTASARYVSVDELREWKRKGLAFAVVDNKTSKDITEVLLASPLH
jgi:polyhydroxyalkanoate synthesis regulator protein